MENKYIGIYNVIGNRGTDFQAKIVPIKVEEYDEEVGVKDIVLDEFDVNETLRCTVAKCCITNSFLTTTRTLPMYYVTVFYKKATVLIMELFRIYLCFTITDNITNSSQLLNNLISGKFHFELRYDGVNKVLQSDSFNYPGEKKVIELLREYHNNDEMKTLITELIVKKDKLVEEKYGSPSQFTIPTKIIKLSEIDFDDE